MRGERTPTAGGAAIRQDARKGDLLERGRVDI
jgi:hypothetical protein